MRALGERRTGRVGPGRREALIGWTLAFPAAALLIALIGLPVLAVLALAATDWRLGAPRAAFVGFGNFARLASDPTFAKAMLNTLVYVGLVAPATVGLGLLVALLIEAGRSLQTFYRAIHLMPFMATLAAMAVVWEALLHPTIGLINLTLAAVGLPTANWLKDPQLVIVVLAVIGVWQNLGLASVLILAGLKTIPAELYDAAAVDGAGGPWARTMTVTLPLLGPALVFTGAVITLRAFEVFDTVQVLTQGGPAGASDVLLHRLYIESFRYFDVGYGAAITMVFLVIVASLTLIQTAGRAGERTSP